MKINNITFTILTTSILVFLPATSYAQTTDTESTQSSVIDTNEVKENIKKRIQEAVENNQEDLLTVTTPAIVGWVGTIESLTDQSISVNVDGTNRLVEINKETQIINRNSPIKLENLEIGTYIIAMGTTNQNQVLSAQRIVTTASLPQKSAKTTILAQVSEIDPKNKAITVLPKGAQQPVEINITSTSTIEDQPAKPIEITLPDIEVGDEVVIIHTSKAKFPDQLEAIRIMRVRTANTPPVILREKISTSSGSL